MFNTNFKPQSGRGSMGIALIFLLIALVGMILIYNGPETKSAKPAPETEAEKIVSVNSGPTFKTYFIRTVLFTAVIILILLTGSRIFRQRAHRDISGQVALKIISRKYIGPRQSLLIVQVVQKQILLGVTDSSIQFLTELSNDDTDFPENSETDSKSFRQIIQEMKKSDTKTIP